MPKSWDINKFTNKLWDIGLELNKVTLGFLRQTLGVHKKTCNLAILAETGKYPICITIFVRLLKYYIRLSSTEHSLLKAARDMNVNNYNSHKPSWLKIIKYLGQITNIDGMPMDTTCNTNKILTTFKNNIKNCTYLGGRIKRTPPANWIFIINTKRFSDTKHT